MDIYKSSRSIFYFLRALGLVAFPAIILFFLVLLFFIDKSATLFGSVNLFSFLILSLAVASPGVIYYVYLSLNTLMIEMSDQKITYKIKNKLIERRWDEVERIWQSSLFIPSESPFQFLYKIKFKDGSSFFFPTDGWHIFGEAGTDIEKFILKKKQELK